MNREGRQLTRSGKVLDLLSCIVTALTDPASVRRYLEGTGQSAEIPEITPARAPPYLVLDFDY